MDGIVWFFVAIVELVIIVYLLASRIHEQKVLQNGKPDISLTSQEGRLGVVKNFSRAVLVLGTTVITFEIHEQNGNVFYAALNGYEHWLSEHDTIEFWPSDVLGAYTEIEKRTDNPDGTATFSEVPCRFYKLKKYRILAKTSVPQ